ncbi:hypothetical protein KIN20_013774 [Parelaphostrongylus tenuis]|uniref:Uncharacterized protein n=1 Tax=Parelaphostrongylus tenuis TaxID=148309 RepID=A0AAD5QNS6_PARTN|nr:hypothetical protein KIN20_013774 [Parelaphostrongylus tenuis]
MMHEWLLGSNTTEASERINLAWGEDTVGKSTVFSSKKSEFYDRGIDLLPEWQEVLEVEGEYFDCDYPPIMRKIVDSNSKAEARTVSQLPKFSECEKRMLIGT